MTISEIILTKKTKKIGKLQWTTKKPNTSHYTVHGKNLGKQATIYNLLLFESFEVPLTLRFQ